MTLQTIHSFSKPVSWEKSLKYNTNVIVKLKLEVLYRIELKKEINSISGIEKYAYVIIYFLYEKHIIWIDLLQIVFYYCYIYGHFYVFLQY